MPARQSLQPRGLRRLEVFARMLDGAAPRLAFLPGNAACRAHLDDAVWLLPESVVAGGTGEAGTGFALIAHAAAHRCHGGGRVDRGALKPVQMLLYGLIEDARVERLAARRMPGLQRLWGRFHVIEADSAPTLPNLLQRLGRCLHDPAHADPHPWVIRARLLVERAWADAGAADASAVRALASRLGHELGQMRLGFDAAQYHVEPAYRDDNAHLWTTPAEEASALTLTARALSTAEGECTAGEGATGAADESGAEPGGGEVPAERLPEWDRLIRRYRAAWCTVRESNPPRPVRGTCSAALARRGRLRAAEAAALLRDWRREDRPAPEEAGTEGDSIDLDALVEFRLARRVGSPPDPRLYRRRRIPRGGAALLVLLDCSASAAASDLGPGAFDSARAAAWALADGAERAGSLVAVYAFASNTRHHVRVQRVKGFAERAGSDELAARLATLEAGWSTRIGAALRFAVRRIERLPLPSRRIAVLSDGDAHDVDIHDPVYLAADLQRALAEAATRGIVVDMFDAARMPG